MLYDTNLSTTARCVYAMLAGSSRNGSAVKLGQRRIGQKLGIHKETVGSALKELEAAGHVGISGEGQARRSYSLRPVALAGPIVPAVPAKSGSIRDQRRVKPSVLCPRCHKDRFGLLRVGICRSCNLDIKLDRKVVAAVREELRATA